MDKEYFDWMLSIIHDGKYAKKNSYFKLLRFLHDVEFTWIIPKDSNRAEDGIDLRWRYEYTTDNQLFYERNKPCSVLEMILALAIRCEEGIMDDPAYGNRTSQWFWSMITNLGLGSMTDARFDISYVEDVIERFLNREYEPDGRGGLFTVEDCEYDLRKIEIWVQMLWYLDDIF